VIDGTEHGEISERSEEQMAKLVPGLDVVMNELRERFPSLAAGSLAKILGLPTTFRDDADLPDRLASPGRHEI
jgi:hypothetical protein